MTESRGHSRSSSLQDKTKRLWARVQKPTPASPSKAAPETSLYERLKPWKREFRVLDVLPAADTTSILHCRLRKLCLDDDDPPDYETISYVWGSHWDADELYLNGTIQQVPESSYAVLRRIRLPDRTRTVWIDALCINQNDIREKAQQVSFMGRIYKSSKGNLIYLGQGTKTLYQGLDDVQSIAKCSVELTELSEASPVIISQFFGSAQTPYDWSCIEKFYNSTWFRRLWIFQEAALAPKSACILGDTTIDFYLVAQAAALLLKLARASKFRPDVVESRGVRTSASLFQFLHEADRPKFEVQQDTTMAALLRVASALDCSDPRDKVYAMLGLRQNSSESLHAWLTPNYSRPVNEVLRDATRFAIREGIEGIESTWGCLERCPPQDQADDDDRRLLPTWVPLWHRHDTTGLSSFPYPLSFSARQPWKKIDSHRSLDLKVLEVAGLVIGQVTRVSSLCDDTKAGNIAAFRSWMEEIFDPTWKMSVHDTVSVVSGGLDVESVTSLNSDLSFLALLQRWFPNRASGLLPSNSMSNDVSYQSVLRTCRHRCVIRTATEGQGYRGLGPGHSQQDDIIVLLRSTTQPYLLRPTTSPHKYTVDSNSSPWYHSGTYYRLVGPCYVDGMMDGKPMQRHIESGAKDELFSIM